MYKTVKTQTNLPVKICHLKVSMIAVIWEIFDDANFRGMAREPSEMFAVIIFAFQSTLTTSFACEIPVRGSF